MTRVRGWVAAAVLLPGLALADGRDHGRTLLVDDDRRQCRYAPFTSIQDAVNAADPGDTIKVCPGSYEETVQIDKTLSLEGSGPKKANERTGNTDQEAVVLPPPAGFGFVVTGSRVTVKRFTFRSRALAAGVGIILSDGTGGHRVSSNQILGFAYGVQQGSSEGPPVQIDKNAFNENAIAVSATSVTGGISISENEVAPALFASFEVRFSRKVEIVRNTMAYGEYGILFTDVQWASVRKNKLHGTESVGIQIFQVRYVEVVENELRELPFGVGLSAYEASRIDVSRNVLDQVNLDRSPLEPSMGMIFVRTDHSRISENVVTRVNGDGIGIGAATRNEIEENKTIRNSGHGLYLFPGPTTGNKLVENVSFGNGVYDMRDDQRPLNHWKRNYCRTDQPPGTICVDPHD